MKRAKNMCKPLPPQERTLSPPPRQARRPARAAAPSCPCLIVPWPQAGQSVVAPLPCRPAPVTRVPDIVPGRVSYKKIVVRDRRCSPTTASVWLVSEGLTASRGYECACTHRCECFVLSFNRGGKNRFPDAATPAKRSMISAATATTYLRFKTVPGKL